MLLAAVSGVFWYYPDLVVSCICLVVLQLALAFYTLCIAKSNDRLEGVFAGLDALVSACGSSVNLTQYYLRDIIPENIKMLLPIIGNLCLYVAPCLPLFLIFYELLLRIVCERTCPISNDENDTLSIDEFRTLVRELRQTQAQEMKREADNEAAKEAALAHMGSGTPGAPGAAEAPSTPRGPLSPTDSVRTSRQANASKGTGETVGEVFRRFDVRAAQRLTRVTHATVHTRNACSVRTRCITQRHTR